MITHTFRRPTYLGEDSAELDELDQYNDALGRAMIRVIEREGVDALEAKSQLWTVEGERRTFWSAWTLPEAAVQEANRKFLENQHRKES